MLQISLIKTFCSSSLCPGSVIISTWTFYFTVITTPTCSKFEPHQFRADLCRNCFHEKKDHDCQTGSVSDYPVIPKRLKLISVCVDVGVDELNCTNGATNATSDARLEESMIGISLIKTSCSSSICRGSVIISTWKFYFTVTTIPTCSKFEPQQFRADQCRNCFHRKKDHDFLPGSFIPRT
jgi:hypothetical protein